MPRMRRRNVLRQRRLRGLRILRSLRADRLSRLTSKSTPREVKANNDLWKAGTEYATKQRGGEFVICEIRR